jgi:hypothetical protein
VKQSGDEITVPPAVGPLDKEEPVKAKVSAKAAAIDVLRKARNALSTSEIVERVVKTPGVKLSAKTPGCDDRRNPRRRERQA